MPKRILSPALATILVTTAAVAAPQTAIELIAEKPVVLVERGDDPIFGALFLSAKRLVAPNGLAVDLEMALETKGAPEGIVGISQYFQTEPRQFAGMKRLCGGEVNFVTVTIFKATPKIVEVGFHSSGPGSDGDIKVVDCARPEFDLVAIADAPAAEELATESGSAGMMKPYDNEETPFTPPASPAYQPPYHGYRNDYGKWGKSIDVNEMDDSKGVFLNLTADEGRSRNGDAIILFARCQSNKTEVFINWHDYLGDDSRDIYDVWKNVQVRIGSKPAVSQRWSVSTNNESTFAPAWAGSLLQQMVGEERMVVSTVPYGGNRVTAVFDIRGLDYHLRELADTCGWSFVAPKD